jgi:hypothetical protein
LAADRESVLREFLRSAKGAALTAKRVRNCFATHSVLREFPRSAKGAARTAKRVRNCFAPQSVLREFPGSAKAAIRGAKRKMDPADLAAARESVLREFLRSGVFLKPPSQ